MPKDESWRNWKDSFPPEELAKLVEGEVNLPDILGNKDVLDADTTAFAMNMGHTFFMAGRYQDAELVFIGLRMCQPENSFHASALGAIYVAEKRYDDALKVLDIAVKLDKTNFEALFNRAQTHLGLGKTKEAIADFKAVTTTPKVDPGFASNAAGYLKLLESAQKGNKK
ncbi:MAG: tetratricopeptide repeat protein [Myxococcaceae bacterium]|nr:tetratricopeptide repeat protein [Myxococcaceae bacterium]